MLPEAMQYILEILTEEAGPDMAWRVVRRLARDFGGRQFYIPLPATLDRDQRDAEIRRVYDGTFDGRHGIKALAQRFELSRSRIYRIVRSAPQRQT
ncbi:MAG: hypothetical protein MZV65_26380 [Chromatiales bacterium]|nr:hypothetical protein [Chromatiales bacterium]